MRFSLFGLTGILTLGLLMAGSAVANERDYLADELPEITICPLGLDQVKHWNAVQLAGAALVCDQMGFLEEAYLFFEASRARNSVDQRLFAEDDARVDQSAVEAQVIALLNQLQLGRYYGEDIPAFEKLFSDAADAVFHWSPQVEGYDPGFSVRAMPSEEKYRKFLRLVPAGTYASVAERIAFGLDPELSELLEASRRVREAGRFADLEELQRLGGLISARRDVLQRAFREDFQPTLVQGLVARAGIFGSDDNANEQALFVATSIIPTELGTRFGIDIEIGGVLPGSHDYLIMRVLHPAFPDADGELQTETAWTYAGRRRTGGQIVDNISFRFERPEQLVPGNWTLEVEYFGRVLVSRTFHVVAVDEED